MLGEDICPNFAFITCFLSAIPEDGRRNFYAEALAKAKAEEEAKSAAEKAREAADAAKKLKKEVTKLSEQEARAASLAEEAQEKAEAAGVSMDGILSKAKDFSTGLSWEKFSSQMASAVQKPASDDDTEEKPKVQIATVRGQAKARTLPSKKAVVKQTPKSSFFPRPKEAPKAKAKARESMSEKNTEVRKVFGGLFKQETIYVDDD